LIEDPVNKSESVSSTSLTLLERAKANDEAAWQRLRSLYAPLVYYWCRKAGVPDRDIADVGQDVFLSVAQKLGGFRRDRPGDTFRGWLRTITCSRIADLRRRAGREPQATGGSDAQRPDWYSTAFLRVVVEGHYPADVAADLGKRTSAVYNVKSRILRRLRVEFAEAIE